MSDFLGVYEASINGRPYRIIQEQYSRRFLDVVRQQADGGQEPSEFSLNPNDLWRRSQTDWTFGAGQVVFDGVDSSRRRFRSSRNIDPFDDRGQICLTNATARIDTNAGALEYEKMVSTEQAVFVLPTSSTTLQKFTTTQTTTAAAPFNIVDMTSIGQVLYVAVNNGSGSGGVYTDNPEWTKVNDVVPDIIQYVRGRLMVGAGKHLYNITNLGSPAVPTSLTGGLLDSGFRWDAIGDSDNFILAAGHSGRKSHVYRVTLREDGTALTPPVMTAQLPDGEFVRAITTYLGVTAVATTEGLRLGTMSNGELILGPLVHEGSDVHDLEPSGQYIYFTRSGGLSRLNLSRFFEKEELVAAHAGDISTSHVHDVVSIVMRPPGMTVGTSPDYSPLFLQRTAATTDEGGLFEELDGTKAVTGELLTGLITYGMSDTKNFLFLEVVVRADHPNDLVQVLVIDEDENTSLIGSIEGGGQENFIVQLPGEFIEVKFVLARGSATTCPVLERWTLRSLPVPRRTEQLVVPLDVRSSMVALNGAATSQDVWARFTELQSYVRTGEIVTYQEFGTSYLASVENVQMGPDLDVNTRDVMWEGVIVVTLRLYDETLTFLQGSFTDESNDMFGVGTFGSGTFGDRD